MLRGVTASACDIAGTAVFKIVVSSDSMKNATATSHGSTRFMERGWPDALLGDGNREP
jgi:hypothetical protein